MPYFMRVMVTLITRFFDHAEENGNQFGGMRHLGSLQVII